MKYYQGEMKPNHFVDNGGHTWHNQQEADHDDVQQLKEAVGNLQSDVSKLTQDLKEAYRHISDFASQVVRLTGEVYNLTNKIGD